MLTTYKQERSDACKIMDIAKQAEPLFEGMPGFKILDLVMDIDATHKIIPLDLVMLEEAGNTESSGYGSFVHDMTGIWKYFDREEGELTDCWTPRFAKHSQTVTFYKHLTQGER
jgi:hypothetical protein